jgi:8-oxo-dGTP pyrophosphatase MutT (NUDIX family)
VNRPRRAREEVSAGGVVFRRDGERTFFLLIRDSYRNWGFPKGHLEQGEGPEQAALREVSEETGLDGLELRAPIEVIDWEFRFRGRRIHKTCHFFLIETPEAQCEPLRAEGITACRWASFEQAERLIAYDNARAVLRQAQAILRPSLDTGGVVGGVDLPRADRATPELPH